MGACGIDWWVARLRRGCRWLLAVPFRCDVEQLEVVVASDGFDVEVVGREPQLLDVGAIEIHLRDGIAVITDAVEIAVALAVGETRWLRHERDDVAREQRSQGARLRWPRSRHWRLLLLLAARDECGREYEER